MAAALPGLYALGRIVRSRPSVDGVPKERSERPYILTGRTFSGVVPLFEERRDLGCWSRKRVQALAVAPLQPPAQPLDVLPPPELSQAVLAKVQPVKVTNSPPKKPTLIRAPPPSSPATLLLNTQPSTTVSALSLKSPPPSSIA